MLKEPLAANAVPAAPTLDKVDITWSRFRLPNGLTVIVHENRMAPMVTLNLWYRVGAKDEQAGQSGFAHLFEHLMFGGSENFAGPYLNRLLEVGATELNGTTSHDRTNYFETVPTHAFDFALFAESDRMGHFYDTISQDILDLQRGVVINEKRQTEGQPYGLIADRVAHSAYPAGHPYAHTVLGSLADIEGASLDDVRLWFKTYYGPSNAVLVLAGDIDEATARTKAGAYFGDVPPGPPLSRPLAWVARRTGVRREVLEDRVPNARLLMVWNTPEAGSAPAIALELAGQILGGGFSSRLHQRLVQELKLAVNVHAGAYAQLICGQFYVVATVREGGNIAEVEKVVSEVLSHFLAQGPTSDELARTQTQQHAGLIRALDRTGAVADLLAMNEAFFGDPSFYQVQMSQAAALNAEQVRAVAVDWLSDGAYVLHVLPFMAQPPTLLPAEARVDRSKPPAVLHPAEVCFPQVQEATLTNGVRVVLVQRRAVPLIECKMILRGGSALEPHGGMGMAALTTSLMSSGAGGRSALACSELAQSNGILLGAGSSINFTGVNVSALKSRLSLGLHMFADMLRCPRLDPADFERVRSAQLEAIAQQLAQSTGSIQRVCAGLMYGAGHAYARAAQGLRSDLHTLTLEQVVDFHQMLVNPGGAAIMVVGDTDLDEVVPALEGLLGGWQPAARRAPGHEGPATPAAPGVYLIDRPGAAQTAIWANLVARPFDLADEPAVTAVIHTLGGSSSSRINMNLREDKHWTYGVRADITETQHERVLSICSSVQSDQTAASMREIRRELSDSVGPRPITEAELHRMQQSTVLALPAKVQTLAGLMDTSETVWCRGLNSDYWPGYANRIRNLRLAEVHAANAQLIDPARIVWIVAGDRRLIEAEVQALGLGELRVINADGEAIYKPR